MKKLFGERIFTTQTAQTRSLAILNQEKNEQAVKMSKTENNARLLLAVYENLNELYDKLSRLSKILEETAAKRVQNQANK